MQPYDLGKNLTLVALGLSACGTTGGGPSQRIAVVEEDTQGTSTVNISSLSGEEPERWLADGGWTVRELDRLTVPLKVNAVTSGVTPESRAWLEYLRERGLLPGPEGYEYWHDLRMLECVPT